MGTPQDIDIWTEMTDDDSKSALPRLGKAAGMQVVKVGANVLAENMQSFLALLDEVLSNQPKSVSGYSIDEIELNLAVNAHGGIELVGKLTAGMEAGIKIKLKARK